MTCCCANYTDVTRAATATSRIKIQSLWSVTVVVSTLATRTSCFFQQSEHTLSGFPILRCAIPTHTGLTQRLSVRRSAHSSHTRYDRPSRFTALQLTKGKFLAKSAWFDAWEPWTTVIHPRCSINFKCPIFHSPSRVTTNALVAAVKTRW
jgi:hypothetical protein